MPHYSISPIDSDEEFEIVLSCDWLTNGQDESVSIVNLFGRHFVVTWLDDHTGFTIEECGTSTDQARVFNDIREALGIEEN